MPAMRTLTPAERRALRAQAHDLHPVVIVGNAGLTAAVLHEIDVNLLAHELIKVRIVNDERDEREAWLARICEELDAASVQHIGKLLVLYRQRPAEEEAKEPRPARTRQGAREARAAKPSTRDGDGKKRKAPGTERKRLVPSSEREVSTAARRRRGQNVEGSVPETPVGNRRRLRGRT